MSNRINPVDQGMLGKIGNKISQTNGEKKVGAEKTGADTASVPAISGDKVELTQNAQLLQRLDKTLGELSAVDSRRIDAVREAIQNGDYEVDAEKIADAMLRFDRELTE